MFSLDRSSRKYVCPHCGRKTFVLYVDEYGQPLSPDVGKCDRQDKCNWHYPPAAYRHDHFITHRSDFVLTEVRKGGVYSSVCDRFIEPSYISAEMLKKTINRNSNGNCDSDGISNSNGGGNSSGGGVGNNGLTRFLHMVFDSKLSAERIDLLLARHGVCTSRLFGGSALFWQIDMNGNIRTGKIMGYDPVTGKRIKHPRPQFQWVHTLLTKSVGNAAPSAGRPSGNVSLRLAPPVRPSFSLKQCYFGSHLLRRDDRRVIWLFESEKAAVIAALTLELLGGVEMFLPIATGGCGGFNPTADKLRDPFDGLQALKGRRVVLFPDEGKYDEWREKGRRLRGFVSELFVATVMERHLHRHSVGCPIERGDGFDDVLLRHFAAGCDLTVLADLLLTAY